MMAPLRGRVKVQASWGRREARAEEKVAKTAMLGNKVATRLLSTDLKAPRCQDANVIAHEVSQDVARPQEGGSPGGQEDQARWPRGARWPRARCAFTQYRRQEDQEGQEGQRIGDSCDAYDTLDTVVGWSARPFRVGVLRLLDGVWMGAEEVGRRPSGGLAVFQEAAPVLEGGQGGQRNSDTSDRCALMTL